MEIHEMTKRKQTPSKLLKNLEVYNHNYCDLNTYVCTSFSSSFIHFTVHNKIFRRKFVHDELITNHRHRANTV